MEYRGYTIEQDKSGFAPINCVFIFRITDSENFSGHGETIEDCVNQIDELLNDECPQKRRLNEEHLDFIEVSNFSHGKEVAYLTGIALKLEKLISQYHNDQELGQQVRKLFNQ